LRDKTALEKGLARRLVFVEREEHPGRKRVGGGRGGARGSRTAVEGKRKLHPQRGSGYSKGHGQLERAGGGGRKKRIKSGIKTEGQVKRAGP